MIKRLSLLRGWAILAVVLNHASLRVSWLLRGIQIEGYTPFSILGFDPSGKARLWFCLAISQWTRFCLPAFFLISGLFVTYAVRGDPPAVSWKTIRSRVLGLIWPFLVWSLVALASGFVVQRLSIETSFIARSRNPLRFYAFVPMLIQFYLFAPLVVRWAKSAPARLLVVAACLQMPTMVAPYFVRAGVLVDLAEKVGEIPEWLFLPYAFYFPLGLVIGFNVRQANEWIHRYRYWLIAAAAVLGILAVLILLLLEADWLVVNLYAVPAILSFLAQSTRRGQFERILERIGKRSYGIYLVHTLVIVAVDAAAQQVAAGLMRWALLYWLLLVILSVGLPWMLMELIARSPARRLYSYLFG